MLEVFVTICVRNGISVWIEVSALFRVFSCHNTAADIATILSCRHCTQRFVWMAHILSGFALGRCYYCKYPWPRHLEIPEVHRRLSKLFRVINGRTRIRTHCTSVRIPKQWCHISLLSLPRSFMLWVARLLLFLFLSNNNSRYFTNQGVVSKQSHC